MNKQQIDELYPFCEAQETSSDSYYLIRLTALWGEDCWDLEEAE